MNSRYSPTERIGVNAVERIVIQELGWIFREQPIVDVGVDAIIEQCEDGNPTGKFIAIQIKSGESNFSISKNRLIYSTKPIHYNYWLSLNIPIILVAHLPKSGKTYWQHVCKNNFKKTDKNWSLEIPKIQELCNKSKIKLMHILSEKGERNFIFDLYSGNVEIKNNSFDFEEKVICISESAICLDNIGKIFSDTTERMNRINSEILLKSYDYKIYINGLSRDISIYSKRLELEINIFSRLYPEGFFAYEQSILFNYFVSKDIKLVQNSICELKETAKINNELTEKISSLKHTMSKSQEELRLIIDCFIDMLELILLELSEANDMIFILLDRIDEHTSHHQPPSLP